MGRTERLSSLIQRKISDIIQKKVQNSKIGFVSITEVKLSGDLQHAKVYYSVLGNEKQKRDTVKGIKQASSFIRSQLAGSLDTKQVPELNFIADDSLEKGDKIIQKIKELEKDETNT